MLPEGQGIAITNFTTFLCCLPVQWFGQPGLQGLSHFLAGSVKTMPLTFLLGSYNDT